VEVVAEDVDLHDLGHIEVQQISCLLIKLLLLDSGGLVELIDIGLVVLVLKHQSLLLLLPLLPFLGLVLHELSQIVFVAVLFLCHGLVHTLDLVGLLSDLPLPQNNLLLFSLALSKLFNLSL